MSNPVILDLVTPEATIPAPDNLLVGVKGAVHIDIVKVRVSEDATLERGTLLMSGTMEAEAVFLPCTTDGLSAEGPNTFSILADTVEIAATEHAETSAYFEGDFNANAVIFPWETEGDDHDEQIEVARESLRRQKIFLRKVHK
jgi:hypothetical protein